MSTPACHFVWHDLITPDAPAAARFYRGVMGWDAQDSGLDDRAYTILSAMGRPAAGLMALSAAMREREVRPGWNGYIGVDDVDAFAARVTREGGTIHRAPEDIPGVGRFAVAADPHGARFMLFTGVSKDQAPEAPPGTPGHAGWHELHADTLDPAFAFYAGLFGWTKADSVDMGPMGIYQLFAAGGMLVGGMMAKTSAEPAASWLYYFNVSGIEAAAARVVAGGGTLLNGPQPVPGGSWIVQCLDPQGIVFAMVSPPA